MAKASDTLFLFRSTNTYIAQIFICVYLKRTYTLNNLGFRQYILWAYSFLYGCLHLSVQVEPMSRCSVNMCCCYLRAF